MTRRFAKGRRAGTLCKHVKTWERAVRFWQSTFQIDWPTEPVHVACYWRLGRLSHVESPYPPAEIEKDAQLCQSIAVKNTLQEVNFKLERVQFGSAKQALPLKYVVALDDLVMRTSAPPFVIL